jgi:hypothetical protein
MTLADYFIDISLIFRQMQARALTPRAVLLPLILIAIAGSNYLHPFTPGGNDLAVITLLTTIGIALGTLSGLATKVWQDPTGSAMARATGAAAALWVLGMGFRFAFSLYATTGTGAEALGSFSVQHANTSGHIWTTALVLMAFGEVLARVGILQLRQLRVRRGQAPVSSASLQGYVPVRPAPYR